MSDTTYLKQGQEIPLSFLAHDGDNSLFVEAVILDDDDNELAFSPVLLTNVGEGRYRNRSYTMPGTPTLAVTYVPYLDAGRTILSQIHGPGADEFLLSDPPFEPIVTNVPDRLIVRARQSQALVQGASSTASGKASDNVARISVDDSMDRTNIRQDQFSVREQ